MKEQTAGRVVETTPLPNEDPATLVELETLLEKHDFWLGFSPIKGWVLLDRKHPRYTDWDRPLILLRDGSIELLSREEFRNEPQGPWALRFWKRLDGATRSLSGPASTKLPEVRRHIEEAVGLRKVKAERAIDCDEDLESRIGEPPFRPEHYLANNIESQEMRAAARRAHYAEALPRRIQWLRGMAGRIQSGSTGPEPAWSKGKAAATHLRENGIDHLWHFTDARNLDGIRREGGLLSRAGLLACGINDAHLVASDYSRSCDEHCGRERYVRMSFIPNSWFFHRVRRQSGLVWLRFSLGTLAVGEVQKWSRNLGLVFK